MRDGYKYYVHVGILLVAVGGAMTRLPSVPSARLVSTAAASAPVPFFYNDVYEVVMPKANSFPMQKYRYIREALQRELGPSSIATFHASPLAKLDELCLAHDEGYVNRFLSNGLTKLENRRIGFPWTPAFVDRALSSTGGTIAATRAVCESKGGAAWAKRPPRQRHSGPPAAPPGTPRGLWLL